MTLRVFVFVRAMETSKELRRDQFLTDIPEFFLFEQGKFRAEGLDDIMS